MPHRNTQSKIANQGAPGVGISELLGRIWNCWTTNLISIHYGYITHAMEETPEGRAPERTLCGVRWNETGLVNMRDDKWWEPGCRKCRRILMRRGLLP